MCEYIYIYIYNDNNNENNDNKAMRPAPTNGSKRLR